MCIFSSNENTESLDLSKLTKCKKLCSAKMGLSAGVVLALEEKKLKNLALYVYNVVQEQYKIIAFIIHVVCSL